MDLVIPKVNKNKQRRPSFIREVMNYLVKRLSGVSSEWSFRHGDLCQLFVTIPTVVAFSRCPDS